MIDALYRSLGSLRAWVTFIIGAVAATATLRSPRRANAAAPLGAASSSLSHRRHTLSLLAVLAAAALGLALLLPGGVLQAQSEAIEYPENGKDPVATFTAADPEGATPITWALVAGGGDPDGGGDLDAADNADSDHFTIDKDGVLKFSGSPDFENPSGEGATSNTYKVVVLASDAATGGQTGYHAVTVKVTDVNEPGKITVATSTSNGTPQYLVGAILTATVSDGDITDADQTFTADRAGEVTGVVWRWYRGGTQITGTDAQDNTYTLVPDDAGQHIRAVVRYVVAGNVDQEMASLTTDYPVLAARARANALKFDPAGVSRTISEGAEDRNVGAPVTATDNHGTIRYSLVAGGDAERFEIDEKTGQITTALELDYEGEAPAVAGPPVVVGSCADATGGSPDRECTVTVTATDSTGEASTNNATVTIMITNVDEKPAFSTGAEAISVPENSTALWDASDTTNYNRNAVADVTYTAADPEGRTVGYSLVGPDASKFKISNDPPVLSFVSKPDFEAKASADGDNVYEVTVRASVGGDTGERTVRVTVGNVDEGPEISGPSTRNFAENGKDSVATFTAADPEGATPITWALVAGGGDPDGGGDLDAADNADSDHFTIDKDGVLKFSGSPDFENPSGEGATSNTYKVVVLASDAATGGQTGYHAVTVKVTDVNEPGKITVATSTSNGTPQYLVGAILTATASDGDITDADQTFTADRAGEVTGVVWRWYRGGTLIADAQGNAYTLVDADANNRIRVVATYRVGTNQNQENASLTTDYPVLAARAGANALKFDPAGVSRTISEGAEDRNVGAPVTATDNHGTIRYSLVAGGDAERFEIDEKTGQITTALELDYEGEAPAVAGPPVVVGSCADATGGSPDRECTVTVTATDSTGEASTNNATVTIMITNVDEKPAFSTGAQTVEVPENGTALFGVAADGYSIADVANVTYRAEDPEERTVTYSLAGPDASKFQLSASTAGPVLSFVSKPDFEAKASADGDNVYEVTVRASAGGDTGERTVRVIVGNVDEAPAIIAGGLLVTGPTSASVKENTPATTAVATYRAAGPDAASATWSLSGADAGDFTITGGVLRFRSVPDYERPADADTDNVYEVTVEADDSENTAERAVTVTVTDADDPVGDPLCIRYDVNPQNGEIDKAEVIQGIDDFLFGTGSQALDKSGVIRLIEIFLFEDCS